MFLLKFVTCAVYAIWIAICVIAFAMSDVAASAPVAGLVTFLIFAFGPALVFAGLAKLLRRRAV